MYSFCPDKKFSLPSWSLVNRQGDIVVGQKVLESAGEGFPSWLLAVYMWVIPAFSEHQVHHLEMILRITPILRVIVMIRQINILREMLGTH